MASRISRSKASTLAKIAALPRFRSPKDLLNEPHVAYHLQINQIKGTAPGNYLSNQHRQLCKVSAELRQSYKETQAPKLRDQLAVKQYNLWNDYLIHEVSQPKIGLSEQQKQRIYEAMLTAKERNQQRLALNRFIKLGYEYAQAFKVDIPLNPIVMMKMVHPHFGYLNNLPNHSHLKYTYEQLFDLIEEFVVASVIRQKGYTLHSSQLVSFIFWRIWSQGQARLPVSDFLEFMKVFKFNLTEENYQKELAYSMDANEVTDGKVRFDVLRQIFLDRDL